MITPSHLIYSWALAKYTEKSGSLGANKKRTVAFILGALTPDVPVFVFFLVCGIVLGYGHEQLWDDMYFNSGWSVLFTLSHSLLLWPLLLLISYLRQWYLLGWFALSACFHIVVDFCVHTADAYRHFWPLTDWRFVSPISYWDRLSYGQYVGVFDSIVVFGLLLWLFGRYRSKAARIGISLLVLLATLRLGMELAYFI